MSPLHNSTALDSSDNIDLISDEALVILNIINLSIINEAITFLGIIANVINIVIFCKQGFSDTVNIGLLGLAVSDLGALITAEWINLLNNPLFFNRVPFIVIEVQHLTGCWPHLCFARISSWITAYITLERCLCVVVPLKIKSIITPRVTACAVVFIFVAMILTLIPEYITYYLGWKEIELTNGTVPILGLLLVPGKEQLASVSINIGAGTQFSSFGAVIFFTTILVIKMEEKSKWRMSTSNAGSDSSKETVNRDNRAVRMITFVAVIYCICFLPMLGIFIVSCFEPRFIVLGAFHNTFFLAWSFAFLLDSFNASVNIIVYYKMSTKYRKTFDLIFRRKPAVVGDK